MSVSDLEKTAAIQILAFLQKKGSATRTDLRENVDAVMETIYSALEILRNLKLIKEEESPHFPFTKTVSLNGKGTNVAERLLEIQQILVAK